MKQEAGGHWSGRNVPHLGETSSGKAFSSRVVLLMENVLSILHGLLPPPHPRSITGYFLNVYYENLVGFLEVKPMKV